LRARPKNIHLGFDAKINNPYRVFGRHNWRFHFSGSSKQNVWAVGLEPALPTLEFLDKFIILIARCFQFMSSHASFGAGCLAMSYCSGGGGLERNCPFLGPVPTKNSHGQFLGGFRWRGSIKLAQICAKIRAPLVDLGIWVQEANILGKKNKLLERWQGRRRTGFDRLTRLAQH